MNELNVTKNKIHLKEYIRRSAKESDFENLITDDTIVMCDGVPIILYVKMDDPNYNVRVACKKIKYGKGTRTQGLKTESAIFGFRPRNTIRQDFCSVTALNYRQPIENVIICNFGKTLAALYQKHFPEIFKTHGEIVKEKILDEWLIDDTPFTSGIVNKNNPLNYHFDTGNITGMLSNMVVFKKDVEGGYLSCPEYNIGFEVADNTVILFNGQEILHGVTPIKKTKDNGYRYSIVYYTLQQMWHCLTITDEIVRIRNVRIDRETKRGDAKISKLLNSRYKTQNGKD
jgi:hypothetical protein